MDREGVFQFFRAVLIGAICGSGSLLLFTAPFGIAMVKEGQFLAGLYTAALPVVIAAKVGLAATTIIGLPLTVWLHAIGRECPRTYAAIGLIAGALIPLITFFEVLVLGLLLAIPGAIAGGVTGRIWGGWRQDLAARRAEETEDDDPPTNPFHDMLY